MDDTHSYLNDEHLNKNEREKNVVEMGSPFFVWLCITFYRLGRSMWCVWMLFDSMWQENVVWLIYWNMEKLALSSLKQKNINLIIK